MRIIGVDPGNAITGFGVVERLGGLQYVGAGIIRGRRVAERPQRLAALYQNLLDVLDRYSPDAMSLERSFVAINVQSAFALGEARAAAMLAAAHRGLQVFEYTPTDVKLSIAGYGRADKAQVKLMVRRTLMLEDNGALGDDAADALAIALCHLFRAKNPYPDPSREERGERSDEREQIKHLITGRAVFFSRSSLVSLRSPLRGGR